MQKVNDAPSLKWKLRVGCLVGFLATAGMVFRVDGNARPEELFISVLLLLAVFLFYEGLLVVADPKKAFAGDVVLDRAALSVVSLNLGGRNLNPLEFVLDGDKTEAGQKAKEVRLRAQEAMVDADCGPAAIAREHGVRRCLSLRPVE